MVISPTGLYTSTSNRNDRQQRRKLTIIAECAESKECHSAKHHYDECAQRVTGQIEDNGKADEDCVEECKILPTTPTSDKLLTYPSLPSRSLRNQLRCPQALRSAQVEYSNATANQIHREDDGSRVHDSRR